VAVYIAANNILYRDVFDRSVFAVLWSSVRMSDAAATDVVSALSADQFA
jgi:hypothetical protein